MVEEFQEYHPDLVRILEGVKTSIDKNHVSVIQIVEGCKNCREDVKSLKNAVVGTNGMGLRTQVAIHKEAIILLQREQQKSIIWSRKLITLVVTSLLGLLGTAALVIKSQFGG